MAHRVVIFDTIEEAEAQDSVDLIEWFKTHPGAKYQAQTTKWAIPRERLDGKYDYKICPGQDYGARTVKDFDIDDYASEE